MVRVVVPLIYFYRLSRVINFQSKLKPMETIQIKQMFLAMPEKEIGNLTVCCTFGVVWLWKMYVLYMWIPLSKQHLSGRCSKSLSFIQFHARFSLERVAVVAAPGGLEIPHGQSSKPWYSAITLVGWMNGEAVAQTLVRSLEKILQRPASTYQCRI